jgi:hypothetical protein
LDAFLGEIKAIHTEFSIVFDPEMTYETSVHGYRTVNRSLDLSRETFPLLAFTRSNVIPLEQASRQFHELIYNMEVAPELGQYEGLSDGAFPYRWRWSQFNVQFKLIANDINYMETFEILYVNRKAINQILEFTIDYPIFQKFRYFTRWSEATDALTFNKEGSLYVALDFLVTVFGVTIVMEELPKPLILFIKERTLAYGGLVLRETVHHPEGLEPSNDL